MGGLCALAGLVALGARNRQANPMAPLPKPPVAHAAPEAIPASPVVSLPTSPKVTRMTPAQSNYLERVPSLRDPNVPRPMNGGSEEFRRNFTPAGARFTSRGSDLGVALHEIRIGGRPLPAAAMARDVAPKTGDGDADEVIYGRGAVTEKYVLRGASVEQVIVLDKSLESLRGGGELSLSVSLDSKLGAELTRKEAAAGPEAPIDQIEFRRPDGSLAFTYGGAVAIDATGRRRAMGYALGEGRLEMTLDAEFLAKAEFPLTIDPLIGSWFYIDGTSAVHQEVDVAFSQTASSYLVVFERNVSASNGDIQCKAVDVNGVASSLLDLENLAGADARRPRVARSSGNTFLVVWQEKSGSQWNIVGIRVAVIGGIPTLIGTKFTIVTFTGSKDAINPSVGWSTTKNTWIVAYEMVYSATDHDIYCRPVNTAGSLGTNLAVDTTVAWDEKPSVTPALGDTLGLAWTKRAGPPPTAGDIYGAAVDCGSVSVGPSGVISNISNDEFDVRLGSAEGIPYAFACWARQFSTIDYDCWVMRVTFNAGAVPVTTPVFVAEGSAQETMRPSCALERRSGGKERLIVAIGVNPTHPPTAGSSDIIAQVYDPSTPTPTFLENLSVSTQAYEDARPSVAINPADLKGLVVWDHAFSGTTDLDPLGQRVDLVNADFVVSPTSGLVTTENGGTASIAVRLKSKPADGTTVSIPVSSSDLTEGTVSPSSLVFTSANWSTFQFITVTGVNDSLTDGDVAYTVVLGSVTSGDPDYDKLDPIDVSATNNDNEPEVSVTVVSNAAEPASTGQFRFTRTGATLVGLIVNYTVTGTATAGTDYTALSGTVTIPASSASVTVPVSPINDLVAEGTETVQVSLTASASYTIVGGTATMNLNDDDVADFAIGPISGNTSEGGNQATFRVHLTSQPAGGATVTIPLSSNNAAEGSVSPPSLTFNDSDWSIDKVVTVTGVNDTITDPLASYQIVLGPTTSGDGFYNNKTPPAVTVINDDNEPEVWITATTPNAAEPSTNGVLTVNRTGATTSALQVFFVSGGSATSGSDYSSLGSSVIIPVGASSAPITVSVLDDFAVEPSETVDVTLAVNPGVYTLVLPWAATVTIADNDVAGFQVSAISGNTTESGGQATFTVRLTSQPSSPVSFNVVSSNTAEGTVSPSSLSFNNLDWSTPKTVTVTGVNDTATDGNQTFQINMGPVVTSDGNYSPKTVPSVAVTNNDNEPEVTIVATTPSASEPSTNGVFTVTRTGSTAGTLTVLYTVSGTATAGADYTAMSGTLNFPATLASQTIIVPVLNDFMVEPSPETVIVTLSAGGSSYTVSSPSSATVNIADNDVANFVVSGISNNTSENSGGTATFTVRLNSQPSANVTLTASTSNTGEGLVSTASFPTPAASVNLTFTPGNWNVNQTVTVTGVNDTITDPAKSYQINLGSITTTDGNYSVLTIPPVACINDDNEPEVSVVVTTNAAEPNVNGVFTLSRTGNTTSALTVTYTVGGSAISGTDYTALTGTVNFAIGAATTTITVPILDDSIAEGLKTVSVTLTPSVNYTLTGAGAMMTLSDNDTAGFIIGAISGHTTENLGTATFTVRLSSQPTGDVFLSLSSSNTAEGTVSPSSLTFNAGNWSVNQLVTVTGVNDTATDGNVTYQITLTPSSGDGLYGAVILLPVDVINDDNEPEVTIVATTPSASEPSTNGVFTVTRTGSTAAALAVNYSVGGTASGGTDYTALTGTVNIPIGATSATIPVTVTDDSVAEGSETVIVTLTANAAYTVKNPNNATVTISDNDNFGFTVSAISGNTTENGGTATFTVRLNSQPAGGASVTIPVTTSLASEGLVSSAGSPVPGTTLNLTFTSANWGINQTVTVTGVNDTATDPAHAYQITMTPTSSGDSNYNAKTAGPVNVVNTDNEPEVTIAVTTHAAEPSTNGLFTVTRTGNTTAALTVNYTVAGTATAGADYTSLTGSVTIGIGSSTATIAVNVLDDAMVEPLETVIVTLSTNAAYTVMTPSQATLNITNNDTAGLVVSTISGNTSEDAGTATFTVKLNSQPSADVTVAVTTADTTEGLVSSSGTPVPTTTLNLTFTNANWNTNQTVTVTGVNDTITDPAQGYSINVGPTSSADGNYVGVVAPGPVAVVNVDNEPEVTVVATTAAAAENGSNGVFTVTRTGNTTTSLTVFYSVTGTATSVNDYSALSGQVTIGIGSSTATIPVTVVNDSLAEVAETVIVTLTPNGAYSVKNPLTATVTISDDDVAGFTISTISNNTKEDGTPATFTVVLKSQPTADVTIPVASSNTAEGTVSVPSLVFTNSNWNTPRTVTVTGVNDTNTDGSVQYQITLGPTSSGDPDYHAKTPAPVTVFNDDNEPEVSIVATVSAAAEGGANGLFTVSRTGSTAGALSVNFSVGGTAASGTDYTALTSPVVIPIGASSATIAVTVTNDDVVEPSETVIVTLTANAAYSIVNPANATVTIADNDNAGFTVSAISGNTTENGGTATFTVRLTSQPSGGASVTIPVTTSLATEGLVSSAGSPVPGTTLNLTFTTGNWNVDQTVTVTGVNDTATDPAHAYQITLSPTSSSDSNYNAKSPGPVNVVNTDNEPEVTIAVTTHAAEPSTNGLFTVTRTGNTTSSLTVNYTVGGTATAGSDYTTLSGSVTIGVGSSTATIPLSVLDDAMVEPLETVVVTLSANAAYTVMAPSQATLNITNNDSAGLVVSTISGPTTEDGGTATFTVKLASQPSADVTVAVTTADTTEGLVSSIGSPVPGTTLNLTFTNANWNTNQTVTVTGVNDSITDTAQGYSINVGPTSSADGNYVGVVASAPVGVVNTDNEPEVTIVATTPGAVEGGANGVFTVSRTGNTTSDLTVFYSVTGTATSGSDYTALPASVTIPTGSGSATITVTVTNDSFAELAETVIVTLTPNVAYSVKTPNTATVTITDNDNAGYTLGAISGNTTEGGGTATFTVVLKSQPTGDVTIPLASNNTGEGTVSPSSLTFTGADWNSPKTVTVTGVNDTATDPAHAYQITLGPTASSDPNYSGNSPGPVNVTNDDDEPEVTIVATVPNAAEPAVNGQFTVTRTGNTTAALTVFYSVAGTATSGTDYTALIGQVTIGIGSSTATIPVTVQNDATPEPSKTVVVTLTPNAAYTVKTPTNATVTIADDDQAGLTVSSISGNTSENLGTATFTVVLNTQPVGGASVTVAVTSNTPGEGLVSSVGSPTPAVTLNLTFTTATWSTPQTVTVTGQNDNVTDGPVGYLINLSSSSSDAGYQGLTASVNVTNTDNEPEVTIAATTATAAEGGGNGVFTVTRTGNTGGSLTVNYTISGTATNGTDYTSLSGSVVIAGGSPTAVITVAAIDDSVVDVGETVSVTLAPGSYTIATIPAVTVTITDNDTAGFVVSSISNNTNENGGTATFTVRLTSQPSGDVNISVVSSLTSEGTVSVPSLTFTSANWNTNQTVTVTGANDTATDPLHGYQINLAATSGDGNYNAKPLGPVLCVNDDNEPEVTIAATTAAASEPSTNGVFTVTRTGNTTSDLTVLYSVTGSATAGSDYTALSGSVLIPTGSSSATITVTVSNDDVVEPDETVIATLTPNAAYTVKAPNTATVTISDNDVSGFTISTISNKTKEDGTPATFTVVLKSQPTADVTIPVASNNTAEGTVSVPSLVFTSANWSTPKTVTVTGVNDAVTDGTVSFQITLGPTSSGDSEYNAKTPPPVAVQNDDNEPEVTIVATTQGAEGGANGVFTVSRTGDTTAALTVNYSVAGTATAATDYTTLPGSVSIPIGASSATITVTVTNDDFVEPAETVLVTLTANASYSLATPSAATVTISDNDIAGFNVSAISGNTNENGGTATFGVSLKSRPSGPVTIPVTTSNAGEGLVSSVAFPTPAATVTLTFPAANWNIVQVVTVTGVNDTVTDPATAYQITLGPTGSGDGAYDSQTPSPVNVVNDDNEPEVTIAATTQAAEGGSNGVFTVTRTGVTTANLTVNYTVSGTATAGADYTSLSGSVVIPVGSPSATITVPVTNDSVAEGPETVIVTLTPSGSYQVMNPLSATVTITDNDVAGFDVQPISGNTTENGGTATFTVRLTSQPTADVTIPVASSNTGEGTAAPASLLFTAANWSTTQTVTVTGANDVVTDGSVQYQITLALTSSTDPNYNSKTPAPVTVFNDDNEPEVTILVTTPATEGGANGVFTVFRTGGTGAALTVNYTVSGSAVSGADYTALPGTVSIPSGAVSATIPVPVINDSIVEGPETVIVTLTANAAYTLMPPSSATMTITDNDIAGFTLTPITGNTTEGGGTATFTVVLNTQPSADVTIPLASSDTTEGTVSPPSLVFTSVDWDTPKLVTVTGVNDAITDGSILYQITLGPTSSGDSEYNAKTPPAVSLNNTDNEPEVTVLATTQAAEGGANGVFTVFRTGDTTAALTVNYSVSGSATAGNDYTALPGSVNIPIGQASATITVTVTDDAFAEAGETVIATLTANAAYTVAIPSAATVTISDNDGSGFIVSSISGNTSENAATATFTVMLSSQPTADVTIPVTTSNGGEGLVSSAGSPVPSPTLNLTFTAGNWNVGQTVTVTGVNDAVTDPATAYQITLGPTSSGDSDYDSKTPPPVNVVNDDNEPEVTIAATTPTAVEGGAAGVFTVTRTGNTAAALTVNYTISGTAGSGTDYAVLSGSVSIPIGAASAPVTVTPVDDAQAEPGETVILTLAPGLYTVAAPSAATVTILDNDAVGFLVSAISGNTSEDAATATFTVRLTSQPTADVTIPVVSSNTGEGTVSTPSLVFTNANWNVIQTVTVTGVNDLVTDPLHAYQINLGPAASADPAYQGQNPGFVSVINDDNEPEVTIAMTSNGSEPGTNGVFTVSRTGATSAALTVNYTVAGTATVGADYTALSGQVTIPIGASSAPITVAVLDDPIVEAPETVLVTLTPNPGIYTVSSPSAATVTIADEDVSGFIFTAITGNTSEAGATATFTVRLSSQPTADVTLPLASTNTAEGTVSPSSLVFTTADWDTPKTVTVTGINDFVTDGNAPYQITLGPTASADPNYQAKTPAPVSVINVDNEPEVTIVATTPNASEPSANGIFTVTRTGDTSAGLSVIYTVSGTASAGGDYTVLSGTIVIPAGAPSAIIPVTVIDDVAVETPETVILTLAAGTYTIMNPSTATVTINDDDAAGFIVSSISGPTTEAGGTATFTVRLTSQPSANVSIGVSSSNPAEGTAFPTTLQFTTVDWSTPKTVTVTGVNDSATDGNVAYQIVLAAAVSSDGDYSGKVPSPVNVTNNDNEPEVSVVATTPNASEPATDGLFTVTRTGSTASPLVVNYSVGGTATGAGDYAALSGTVTIPAGSLTAPVVVQVVDDGVVETSETVTITIAASASYTVVPPAAATVTITDDDVSGFAVTPTTGLQTNESGGTATFTVRLTSVPTSDVTIPVATGAPLEGLVSSAGSPTPAGSLNLTFTVLNWNVPQTVTLTGVNDTATDGDIPYAVILGPTSSSDPSYNAKTPPAVSATNRDNEPEVTIVATTPGASEPNINGVFAITRTGSTAGALTVNYSIGGTATSGSDYSSLSGSVIIPSGQSSADVTVALLDDAQVETPESVILTLTASPSYTITSPSVATVTIGDNDVAGITVRQIGTETTEIGGTATFTIVLDTIPSSDVTISVTSSNPAEGTVSPSSVTFTPANALTARTITVTGVADNVVDADIAYTVFTNAAVSADPNYNGMDAADVSLTNKNTDVLGFFITPITGLMTSESGGTATFSVKLTTVPTAAVTLPLTTSNPAEGLVSTVGSPVPGNTVTLTFLPGDALTPQVVTVTGVNDGAVDGNIVYTILSGPASSADGSYNTLNPVDVTVLNLDNDGPAITLNPVSGLTTSESGGTATFDVVLNQAPAADVTITLSTSNAAEGLISSVGTPTPSNSLNLTFTTANWDVPQTVTVTGVDDSASDGDILYRILTAPAVSTDPNYNGRNPADVNVTNLDDEPVVPPQIVLNIGSLSFTASEGSINPAPQSLAVTNGGNGTLNWTASVDVPWASETPSSGSVTTGADFITVSVNVTGLAAGTYTGFLSVSAPGASNSPQTLGITLTILPPAPTVQITSPAVNPFQSSSDIVTLQGVSAGNATLISWSNAATGETGSASGPVDNWFAAIPLTAGDNVITVFAWNSGGAGLSIMTVHYDPPDSTPPTLAITDPNPAPTFTSPSSSVTLGGPVSDNIGVAGVTWINLTTGTEGTATVTTLGGVVQWGATVALTSGANIIQVKARDDAGNVSTVAATVLYTSPADGAPPQITIQVPTTGDFWPSSVTPLPMAGTAFDPVGVAKVTWWNFNTGGRGVATGTSSWSANVPLTLGGNFIAISAVDPSGNESTTTLLVSFKPQTADKVPPFLMVLAPSQSPVLNLQTTSVSLGGAAADDVALNTVVWANPATGSSGTANGLASWTMQDIPLVQGVNVVTLSAYDTSGNKTEKQLFVVYTPPPPPPVHIKAGACGLTGLEGLLALAFAWGVRRAVRRSRKGMGR